MANNLAREPEPTDWNILTLSHWQRLANGALVAATRTIAWRTLLATPIQCPSAVRMGPGGAGAYTASPVVAWQTDNVLWLSQTARRASEREASTDTLPRPSYGGMNGPARCGTRAHRST